MLKEFRDFLLRGNLIVLAVAFVMGSAFAALVTALVQDIVTPIIAAVFGKVDVFSQSFTIHRAQFLYGAFITSAITFVSIAAAVFFFIVKPVDALTRRFGKPAEETGPSDEERRHQELLAALGALAR
ncbi:MAG TPA: large conductance mechanosensitive channel protein MscL [Coriobacteriia bacterium]